MKRNQGSRPNRAELTSPRRAKLRLCKRCNTFHVKSNLYRAAYERLHEERRKEEVRT